MCCLPTLKFHGILINKFKNKMRCRHALNVNHLIETIRCIQFAHGGHLTSHNNNKHTSLTHLNYDICPLFAMSYVYLFSLSLSLFSSFINRWENQLHINWSANCDTKTRFYFFVSFSLNQYLFIRFVRCYWIFNRKQTMAPCRYKNCFRNEKKINIVNQEFFSFEYS